MEMQSTKGLAMPRRFVSINHAARELDVDHKTIRRAIANGEIFAVRIGRIYRIPSSVIDAMLNGGSGSR